MAAVKMKINGLEPLLRRLGELDAKLRKKTLKKATEAGSRILLAEMKSRVPRDTGMLIKALGQKIRVYRNSGIVVAIVGPRTGLKRIKVPKGRFLETKPGSGRYRDTGTVQIRTALGERFAALGVAPTRYAHLVEFGTAPRVSKSGRNSGQMPARPFMRPALETAARRIMDVMREVIEAGLAEAAGGK